LLGIPAALRGVFVLLKNDVVKIYTLHKRLSALTKVCPVVLEDVENNLIGRLHLD